MGPRRHRASPLAACQSKKNPQNPRRKLYLDVTDGYEKEIERGEKSFLWDSWLLACDVRGLLASVPAIGTSSSGVATSPASGA